MRLIFHLYCINHSLQNWNNEICSCQSLFFEKWRFKPHFFFQEPLRRTQNDCNFPSIPHLLPPLEIGNHEVCMGYPLSGRRTCNVSVFPSKITRNTIKNRSFNLKTGPTSYSKYPKFYWKISTFYRKQYLSFLPYKLGLILGKKLNLYPKYQVSFIR